MSKRYGRNQKRAAREKIVELQRALDMQRGIAVYTRNKMDNYEATINRVAKVLGPNFYGLPAVKREVDVVRQNYRMPSADSASAFMMMQPDMKADLVRYAVNNLDVMLCTSDMDYLRDTVHLMLHGRDGKIGYAISRNAMETATVEDVIPYFTQLVAREMTELFVRNKV